jgi:hypothetical protein
VHYRQTPVGKEEGDCSFSARNALIGECVSLKNILLPRLHCEKRKAIFPPPAGMSENKLSLAGNCERYAFIPQLVLQELYGIYED